MLKEKEFNLSQKEGYSSCGTFRNTRRNERNGEPLQAGLKNYHLYGYKVLAGESLINDDDGYGYMDPDAVSNKPILDASKIDKKLFLSTDAPGANCQYNSSTLIEEFYSDFNSGLATHYQGVAFSGDIHTSFGVRKQTSSEQVFIRQTQFVTNTDNFFEGVTSQLIEMLSDQFKDAVKLYKEKPSQLFDEYGTHLMQQFYLGGRTDLNFTYLNSTSKSKEEIESSVNLCYLYISGEATAEQKKSAQEFMSNSIMTFTAYGGDPIIGTNPDEIADQFQDWAKSISKKPNLCKIASFDQSLLPIWELIDDPELKNIYQKEFDDLAVQRQNHLNSLKYVKTPEYVTDILVVYDGKAEKAKSKVPDGYEYVYLNPGTQYKTILDTNHDAGGDFIFIVYNMGTNKEDAIVDIQVLSGKNHILKGWTKIDVDLNRDAGGDYIYMYYQRASAEERNDPKTKYIREIRGTYGKTKMNLPPSWYWLEHMVDLNRNAGGSYIYLAVRKTVD